MYISFSFNSLVIILYSHKISYNYSQFPDLATAQTNCIIFVFKHIVYICISDTLFFKLLKCVLKLNYCSILVRKMFSCSISISFLCPCDAFYEHLKLLKKNTSKCTIFYLFFFKELSGDSFFPALLS